MSNILQSLSQNFVVDNSKCVFCATCVDTCILDNLRLKVSPCRQACPLGLNCQGYIQLIARGELNKALEIIKKELPFPGIIGRICHHPCENECSRLKVDGYAVAIRELKRFLADNVVIEPEIEPQRELEQSVAIIGGGPAGIMAAYQLRKLGFKVIIYEAENKLGGMLVNNIPQFKLPLNVVVQELSALKQVGVEVKYNITVGKDIFLEQIVAAHDAVILALGAQKSKKLGLEGEDYKNVYGALDFLKKIRVGVKLEIGSNVAIIGGGNTAIDVAQSARRLGAKDVRIFCLESLDTMQAFPWQIQEAHEEGIVIDAGWGPNRLLVDNTLVTGIEFKKCLTVFNKEGKFAPIFSDGELQTIFVDTVIVAIGQETDLELLNGSQISTNKGLVSTNSLTLQTDMDKVFAAGDVVSGPSSVIEALAQGREAAESIRRFLQKLPLSYGRDRSAGYEITLDIDTKQAVLNPRVLPERLEKNNRNNFEEVEKSLSQEQAIMEAKRCLSCGEAFGKYNTCWSCLACEVECPEGAIDIKVPYLIR